MIGSNGIGVDVYPSTSANLAALTGITPTALYLFRSMSGTVADELGGAALAANGSPVYQAQVGDMVGVDYSTANAGHRADVNALGTASWLYAAIIRAPRSATPALPGAIGRFDAAATVGAATYSQVNASVSMLVKDGTSTLALSSAAGAIEFGAMYLVQLQIDRLNSTARMRWSRVQGGTAITSSGSIAGFLTLTGAGQTFGVGSLAAPFTYGAAVSWSMAATGAQCEGANVTSAFAVAMGAE